MSCFLNSFQDICVVFHCTCIICCHISCTMENLMFSLLCVQYVNYSRSFEYPFVGPLYTILEIIVAIDFTLKVGIIFIKENFSKGCIIVIHRPSILNGLSILVKANAMFLFFHHWSINSSSYGLSTWKLFQKSCRFIITTSSKHSERWRSKNVTKFQ